MSEKDGGPAIKLVINGGQPVVDSAQVPVQWFFSREILKKIRKNKKANHTYLLFVVQTKEEAGDDRLSLYNGRRYCCPVQDRIIFLPFHGSGSHQLAVHLFVGQHAKSCAKHFLKKDSHQPYYEAVSTNIENATVQANAEFQVPEQLFAQKPRHSRVWQ